MLPLYLKQFINNALKTNPCRSTETGGVTLLCTHSHLTLDSPCKYWHCTCLCSTRISAGYIQINIKSISTLSFPFQLLYHKVRSWLKQCFRLLHIFCLSNLSLLFQLLFRLASANISRKVLKKYSSKTYAKHNYERTLVTVSGEFMFF